MSEVSTWNPVDESNISAVPNGWPENMAPSGVNNCARAMMGAIRRFYDTVTAQVAGCLPLIGGTITGNLTINGALGVTGVSAVLPFTTINGGANINGKITVPNDVTYSGKDTIGDTRTIIYLAADNTIRIGDDSLVIRSNGSIAPSADNTWDCGIGGAAWRAVSSHSYATVSDRRRKTDIVELPADCLSLVGAIKPCRYRIDNQTDDRTHWGFIAQDVGAAMAAAGHDFAGHVSSAAGDETLAYDELIPVLWKAAQDLVAHNAALAARIDALENRHV